MRFGRHYGKARAIMERRVRLADLDLRRSGGRIPEPREPGQIGRPKSADPLCRDVHLRLTDEEHALLVGFAQDRGQKPGVAARRILRAVLVHKSRLVNRGRTVEV